MPIQERLDVVGVGRLTGRWGEADQEGEQGAHGIGLGGSGGAGPASTVP